MTKGGVCSDFEKIKRIQNLETNDHGEKIDVLCTEEIRMTLTILLPAINPESRYQSPMDSFGDQPEGGD